PHPAREAVALAHVAGRAGGDDVLPDRPAAAATRHDVVERQAPRRGAAVHAAPAVPREQRPPPDAPLPGARPPDVLDEPDHMWPREGSRRGSERLLELLDHLGLALEHEDVRAANGGDVQWLVAGVEYKNLLQRHEFTSQ